MSDAKQPNLQSKITGALLGVMIGDAMGMPVEMMTPEEILKATDGKGVTGFISPLQRRISDTMNLKPGMTTDDWQLTKVVAESLLRCDGFDLTDMALGHVKALEESTFGWGTTTRKGLEDLKEYFDSRGVSGRSLTTAPIGTVNNAGVSRGCGNGVAMKIAPLGFLLQNYANVSQMIRQIKQIGRLTHPDDRAWVGACAIAYGVYQNLDLHAHEQTRPELLSGMFYICEEAQESAVDSNDSFSSRLNKLTDMSLCYGPIEKLRETVGTGCITIESVCFAVAIFLRNRNDFRAGILEAVNSGGDTDSTASMVGALIGSTVGVEGIPKEWVSFNPDFQQAIDLGQKFFKQLSSK